MYVVMVCLSKPSISSALHEMVSVLTEACSLSLTSLSHLLSLFVNEVGQVGYLMAICGHPVVRLMKGGYVLCF